MTHAVVHHTPDDKVVTLQNMLSRIGTIFGLKFDNPIHHEEPLADRFRIIERCYHDLTMLSIAAMHAPGRLRILKRMRLSYRT
ncbi:hypothetical protein BKM20_27750 [Pseudomonas avellanae]|uniref:Uncharacterized protein n=1 Tax=Pseudomonas avellanae pv. morsprunorum TaxID=3380385 RepID=A0ABX4YPY8_9PSED|nr:hypothetical protein AL055_05935 [Pseudomonas amygdali pv. morsprunorum]POC82022.1 hypothetical protein BKM26_27680 [Pseudomonas avellanae]POC99300.1 hypothetical protein BKM20_27750 [Pseudomonas avellanae]